MLKRSHFIILLLLLISVVSTPATWAAKPYLNAQEAQSELYKSLKTMEGVVSVEKMETEFFKEKYAVVIEQLIDPKNPNIGTFTQRFFISHNDFSKPMVMVTEGYTAKYAMNPKYRDEISKKLGCNLVVVEHRFFAESTPKGCDWKYMTGFNAANDLHKINQGLRKIYPSKFITTGISKGGQTTMLYKTYFPNDADISVPYVGPICFGVEDGRHEPFLANKVGTAKDREIILAFQKEVLKRRDKIVPMIESFAKEKGYIFKNLSFDEVLDYSVLEYPFALWQWGTPTSKIPSLDSSDEELFTAVIKTAGGAEYFANMGDTAPFFVQAAQDLGYYGYDVKPFEGLLKIKSAKDYLKKYFLPEEAKNIKFNNSLHKDMYNYLKNNDPKMIFIYGEWDPWTAAAPQEQLFHLKTNMMLCIEPQGSHRARISTLPTEMQTNIWNTIEKWLNE